MYVTYKAESARFKRVTNGMKCDEMQIGRKPGK